MGFSRQDSWSGLPCPSAGDLPDPGIEPMSPADGSFTSEPPGRPQGPTHCRATEPNCPATIEPAYLTAQEPQLEKIHELQ